MASKRKLPRKVLKFLLQVAAGELTDLMAQAQAARVVVKYLRPLPKES